MDEKLSSNNPEIAQALKEFEVKSKEQNVSYKAVKFYNETDAPKIVELAMKYSGGDQRRAEYVILGVIAAMFIVSMYLFIAELTPDKPKIIPRFQEDIAPEVRAKMPLGVWETIPSRYDQGR